MLNFHGLNHHRAVSLVDNVVDMGHAPMDPKNKLILIKAKNSDIIHESGADIAFCMAITQELNYLDIYKYFNQMRLLAFNKDSTLYWCNREPKTLPAGQVIQSGQYPGYENASVLFYETCPWHDKYYRSVLPIYSNYDGAHRHRSTKMSPNQ